MGTVVEVYHDGQGIIWPESIAPFKAHLLQVGSEPIVAETAEAVYDKLLAEKIEVLFDDRLEISSGQKFADADLIGIPYRLVVSTKTNDKIELKMRNETQGKLVEFKELIKKLKKVAI